MRSKTKTKTNKTNKPTKQTNKKKRTKLKMKPRKAVRLKQTGHTNKVTKLRNNGGNTSHQLRMNNAGPAKAIAHAPVAKSHAKHYHHHHKHHGARRVEMTPEAKTAMQAITSPFKVEENVSRIPDGLGGESFSTTDKLRKSENEAVWLTAIRDAERKFKIFGSGLKQRAVNSIRPGDASGLPFPYSTAQIGALAQLYQNTTSVTGWPFLAINCPITPFYNTRYPNSGATRESVFPDGPILLEVDGGPNFPVYDDTWKDILVNKVYYFAMPGTVIDITKGALGGATNLYHTPIPTSLSYEWQQKEAYPIGPSDLPAISGHMPVPNAADEEQWFAQKDIEQELNYPVNLTAPMQIYRVCDFTFAIPGVEPTLFDSEVELSDMIEAMKMVNPGMSDQAVLKAVESITTVTTGDDQLRYRAQIITPLAGVTDWDDFSDQLGNTLNSGINWPVYDMANPPSSDTEDKQLKTKWKNAKVKSKEKTTRFETYRVTKGRSRSLDIEDCDEPLDDIEVGDHILEGFYPKSQVNPAGALDSIYVESDFTYRDGHNGVQRVEDKTTVDLQAQEGDGTNTIPVDQHATRYVNQTVTTSLDIDFVGSLVAARRVVGFGMKLFSTEAALTADGRVVGGELPISLVTRLINYQDVPMQFPVGTTSVPPTPSWQPLPDRMDEWANEIESRLMEYTAYRALDGCTVRYNPLQTEAQTKFSYTKDACKLKVTPVQLEYRNNLGLFVDQTCTAIANAEATLPQIYEPASDGSEMVPVLIFAPADPIYLDKTQSDAMDPKDGLFFQAVLHTENHTTNAFPMCDEESIYDPNWDLYARICAEPENFPIVVKGHSFKSFMRKVKTVTETAMKFGAAAIDVGEVMLPLISMAI